MLKGAHVIVNTVFRTVSYPKTWPQNVTHASTGNFDTRFKLLREIATMYYLFLVIITHSH